MAKKAKTKWKKELEEQEYQHRGWNTGINWLRPPNKQVRDSTLDQL